MFILLHFNTDDINSRAVCMRAVVCSKLSLTGAAAGRCLYGSGGTEIILTESCRPVVCLFLKGLTDSRTTFTSYSQPKAYFMASSPS